MAKKKISRRTARRHLRDIQDKSKHFYTRDGRVLRNLFDLYAYLKACEDEHFRHHVDGNKNDFAGWVRHVIGDEELAGQMDNCVARLAMQGRVLRRVNHLVSYALEKPSESEKARMILEEAVVQEELFVTADGRVLRSLWELHDFIKQARPEVFSAHVNENKNDISDWVSDVLEDDELAARVRGVRDKDWMAVVVGARAEDLRRKAGIAGTHENEQYLHDVASALK